MLVLLASCGPNKHVNAWDRQSSALDPVGITSKKMAAKNKAEQAFYKPGEAVTFKKDRMMVFEQNPESNFSTSGTVRGGVKTGKVLVCGDLFAKVEFEDGSQGYVSLSEIVNPQEMMGFYPVSASDLIGPDGAQLGIVSAREAMAKAQEAGLDLVKIAPQAKPPVCKIIDYGKYRYELARKEKEARKKQKTIDVKEVRLSPNIDTNDLKTKVNAARKFLSKGDRVKVTLRFRGREMAHMSSSKHVLDDFADLLSDIATVEKAPKVEGRSMTMFLTEKR